MYFTKIVLDNFQSHRHSELILNDKLTIISGESGSGKTSVVRALDFILYGNYWDECIRHGEKVCSVRLYCDDGLIIERQKGIGINKYIINKVGEKPDPYDNFGKKIPKYIQSILGTQELYYDENLKIKPNISTQFEKLFLFAESGPTRMKVLGLLGNLNTIDVVLRDLNKDSRNLELKAKDLTERVLSLEKECEQYQDLPSQEAEIGQIEAMLGQMGEMSIQLEKVLNIKNEWLKTTTEAEAVRLDLNEIEKINLNKAETDINNLLLHINLCNEYKRVHNELEYINVGLSEVSGIDFEGILSKCDIYGKVTKVAQEHESINVGLSGAKLLLEVMSTIDTDDVLESINLLSSYRNILSEYHKINLNRYNLTQTILTVSGNLTIELLRYKDGLLQLKKCPTCGGVITEELIQKHLEEI